ncbi:MAG: SurA N-terminal domain-containing protein [Paracoccaceae bacterium]|nr:SurA N-terminal domain-containing protein [Paracoccaceae bacterium]
MMRSMRAKGNKTLVYILIGLLIVGLAGFGIGGLGGGTIRTVATVGDAPVSVNTYATALNQRLQQIARQVGRSVSVAEAESLGVFRDVLQEALADAAIDNEAGRMGISVGDRTVRDELMAIPAFQGIDGNFDQTAYEFAVERSGLTPSEFEEQLRQGTSRILVRGAIAGGLQTSGALIDAILDYEFERRDFEWVKLGIADLNPRIEEPTDAELSMHHADNPDAYMSPLTRTLAYAWLTPDMLMGEASVGEDELRDAYDAQAERFNQPERRDVERIVFGTTAEAAEARARIDSGETSFDDLVRERGLQPADITLGMVAMPELEPEAGKAVFSLDEPGLAGPAGSALGPALFRVNAIRRAATTVFEDAREDLHAELARERAVNLVSERVSGIDDLLAAGASVEDVVSETDMDGGILVLAEDESPVEGVAAYAEVRAAAWSLSVDDFPEILDLDDGGIFILRLDSVRDPEPLSLTTVKDQVARDWKRETALGRLADIAESLRPRFAAGGEFTGQASDFGFDVELTTETDTVRNDFRPGVPTGLVRAVFDLALGEVAVVENDDGVSLARLTEIKGPGSDVSDIRAQLLEFSDRSRGLDLLALFTTAVEESEGVSLNQAAINSVNTQLVIGSDG